MHLTGDTTFTLQTLQNVALHDPASVTVATASKARKILWAHLVKVAHEPGQRGYAQTLRARNGRMHLVRPANATSVGEAVRRTSFGPSPLARNRPRKVFPARP